MTANLLNDHQGRRLATHLSLLLDDLDAIARLPELAPGRPGADRLRASLAAVRAAVGDIRSSLALPGDVRPSLKRRVAAVAEVWAARVEDLRARRLKSYGDVHPDLPRVLDPLLDRLLQALEALGAAASELPEDRP
ncbi:MAG TPA: hypothetical protein VNI61_03550 [Gemmatimonadales bacterium]|nr:hypothetical protein [Gemmatimonadales bacterium]